MKLDQSLDVLTTGRAFEALRSPEVVPYDLVVFDEAHKLSASRSKHRIRKTQRYQPAETLAGVTTKPLRRTPDRFLDTLR